MNLSGSVASLKEQPCAANSAENENEKSAKVFAGKDARKIWRGSSSSVRRDRSSRRRRRKTSPEQLSLENSSVQASASVDGKTKSLSRLGVNTTADPNTSSSNESVYSNKYVKYSNHSIPIPALFSNGKFLLGSKFGLHVNAHFLSIVLSGMHSLDLDKSIQRHQKDIKLFNLQELDCLEFQHTLESGI